ncbi:MAG: hypothetical protein DCF22_11930 [Leptolyngbya sp.]|nr:MAG: hypothetical protein DCF22_11930 [Leptolyngbya sp.]
MSKQNKKQAESIQAGDTIYLPKQRKKVTVTEVVPRPMWHNDLLLKWEDGQTVISASEKVIYY